jgi:hypothetical protein
MIDSTNLPHPLPSELEGFNKANYFERVYEQLSDKSKNSIDSAQLVKWIHQNFDSVKLQNKSLTYGQFKKIL